LIDHPLWLAFPIRNFSCLLFNFYIAFVIILCYYWSFSFSSGSSSTQNQHYGIRLWQKHQHQHQIEDGCWFCTCDNYGSFSVDKIIVLRCLWNLSV